MNSNPILLLCGSRTLVDREGAREWARGIFRQKACNLSALVSGDAPGPDSWVREFIPEASSVLSAVFYHLDGTIQDERGTALGRWCPADEVPVRGHPEYRRWPLTRNAVMVRAVQQRARQSGRIAMGLGLIDPESRTYGTQQTLGLCTRAFFDETQALRFVP